MKKLILICGFILSFYPPLVGANPIESPEMEIKSKLTNEAFSCAILNGWLKNENERDRLFRIGVTNGTELADAFIRSGVLKELSYLSVEFRKGMLVGYFNSSASEETYKKIYADNGLFDKDIANYNAMILKNQKNCDLLR